MVASRFLLFVPVFLGATGCVTASPAGLCGAKGGCLGSPQLGLDGSPQRVDLLARAFLADSDSAEPGFAYYAYVVFAVRDQSTATARRQVALSYLDMFTDVSGVSAALVQRKDLAILYAPIRGAKPAALASGRDPEALLNAYDYDRARVLVGALRRAGRKVPDVSIIGCPTPLDPGSRIDMKDVSIVDLSMSDDEKIRERIQTFRDSLESGKGELNASGEPAILKHLRKLFALVGAAEETVSSLVITIS